MKHLLSIRDLGRDDVPRLFALTADLKVRQKARKPVTPLQGRTMALVFEKPSLRTRVTFEVACAQDAWAPVTPPFFSSNLFFPKEQQPGSRTAGSTT